MDPLDPELPTTVAAMTQLLGSSAPNAKGEAVFRGTWRGRPVEAVLSERWSRGRGQMSQGRLHTTWFARGPTFGVRCACSPPARFDAGKSFTGNPGFDARYSVNGAPRAVLARIVTPEVQARMLSLDAQLHIEGDEVRCFTVGAHDAARAAGALDLATDVLEALPSAITAAGLEPEVRASGTLAGHAEVRALDGEARRWLLLALAAVALAVLVPLVLGMAALAYFLGYLP